MRRLALALLLLAPAASAAKTVRFSLYELMRRADLIVLGRSPKAGFFDVESVLKGQGTDAAPLVSPLLVIGTRAGEQSVLALQKDDKSWRIAGGGSGRMPVGKGRAGALSCARAIVDVAALPEGDAADRAMLKLAESPDPCLRGAAAEHIVLDIAQSTRAKAYQRPLTHLLDSPDTDLRVAAAAALKPLKSEEAEPILIGMTEDKDERVVDAASQALGPYDTSNSVEALVRLTRHESPALRLRAGLDLGNNSLRPEAKAALIKLLDDKSPLVRRQAPHFLTRWVRNKDAADFIDAVKSLSKDRDPQVRAAALEVLREFNDPRYR